MFLLIIYYFKKINQMNDNNNIEDIHEIRKGLINLYLLIKHCKHSPVCIYTLI